MKKLFVAITVIAFFGGCKGKGWSSAEKTIFINTCAKNIAGKLGEDKAKMYCTCMQQKLEAKYPNEQDANKAVNAPGGMDTPEMNAIVDSCVNDGENVNTNPLGNPGGNINLNPTTQGGGNTNTANMWTDEDKQKLMNACMENMAQKLDNATGQKFCNCVLGKMMQKHKNYAELDENGSEEEGHEVGQACKLELNITTGGNTGGNTGSSWSDEDKQKLMNECTNVVAANFDNVSKQRFCNCFAGKMMQRYANYAELDKSTTMQEGKQISKDCVTELDLPDQGNTDNTNGNQNNRGIEEWTREQHQQFVQGCSITAQQKQGMTAQEANTYCDCVTTKIEHKYTFDDASHLKPADLQTQEWQKAMIDCGARH